MQLAVALIAVLSALFAAWTAVPSERRYVLPCAVALALNWIWYVAAFLPAPYAPTWLIYKATGATIQPTDLFAFADALTAIWVISKAWNRFWGIGLHALYMVQIVAQMSMDAEPRLYAGREEAVLSVLFYLQIACLLVGGWSGVEAQIAAGSHLVRRGFLVRPRPTATTRQEEYARIEASPLIQRIKRGE